MVQKDYLIDLPATEQCFILLSLLLRNMNCNVFCRVTLNKMILTEEEENFVKLLISLIEIVPKFMRNLYNGL